jgi:hypothetical protein
MPLPLSPSDLAAAVGHEPVVLGWCGKCSTTLPLLGISIDLFTIISIQRANNYLFEQNQSKL